MPGTRYIEVYKAGTDIPKLDHKETYEVSDEQLEQEANEKLFQDILDMADSDIKVPQIGKILKALIKSRR